MGDANISMMSDRLANMKPLTDGSGANMAQQVSIEADRLSGTIGDGVEAAQAASKSYSSLLADSYARMIKGSIRTSADFGDHCLALLRARTIAEVFQINAEFMHKQAASAQERFFEIAGIKDVARSKGANPGQRP